jgi:hypothetical protein
VTLLPAASALPSGKMAGTMTVSWAVSTNPMAESRNSLSVRLFRGESIIVGPFSWIRAG